MTRRCRAILSRAAIASLLAMGLAAPVLADEDDPIVLGEQEKPPSYKFEMPKATLLFESTWLHDKQKDNISENRSEDFRLDESLSLSTSGYVVHPSVVSFDLAGAFGLTQLWIDDDDHKTTQNGILYEYDAKVNFFSPRPLSGNVYAKRDRSWISRTFGPSFESITESYGAALDLRQGYYTSHLEAFHATSQLNSPGDPLSDFDYAESTILWNNRARLTDRQELEWNYTFSSADQNSFDFSSQTQRSEGDAQHTWRLGADKESSLTSSLHYLDQSGDFSQQYFRWEEHLRLHHSKTFETDYRYMLDSRDANGFSQTRQRATAGLTHHLYESLVTSAQVGIEDVSADGSPGSLEYFGNFYFDYRKKVPYGTLSAGLGAGYDRRETDSAGAMPPVVDQAFEITDQLTPIVLIDPNLRADTIVLTDPTGLRVYVRGVDYNVIDLGERVQIRPVIGGPLTAGKFVLIDWQFSSQPANTTETTNFNLNARYAIEQGWLKGLAVYGRYYQQDQSINSDEASAFVLNSFTDTLAGAEYRIYDFIFTAEQEWRRGEIYPFDITRFSARWDTLLLDNTKLLLNASYSMSNYPDTDNHVDLWVVSGQVQQRIGEYTHLSFSALWRDETDDRFGHTTGWEQQLELNWKYRQTTVYVRARNSILNSDDRDTMYQEVQVGLQREL